MVVKVRGDYAATVSLNHSCCIMGVYNPCEFLCAEARSKVEKKKKNEVRRYLCTIIVCFDYLIKKKKIERNV